MSVSRPTPTEVANQLRNDILAGRLQAGHRLTEIDLCQRFTVGRGRVREAIHQLVRQGLVITRSNRGAIVAADAPKDIRELIIPIRRTLEVYALQRIFDDLDEATFVRWEQILIELHGACERQDYHSIAEADVAFHRLLLERADQPDLMVIWETLVGRIHSHFLQMQWKQARLLDIYDEHRLLVDTFKARDRETAVKLLNDKIE